MQEPTAQRAQARSPSDESAYEKSLNGSLLAIDVVVVLAERDSNACLEGFLEAGLDFFHFIVAGQLRTLLIGDFVAFPRLVDLLDLDDLAGRGADRQH